MNRSTVDYECLLVDRNSFHSSFFIFTNVSIWMKKRRNNMILNASWWKWTKKMGFPILILCAVGKSPFIKLCPRSISSVHQPNLFMKHMKMRMPVINAEAQELNCRIYGFIFTLIPLISCSGKEKYHHRRFRKDENVQWKDQIIPANV